MAKKSKFIKNLLTTASAVAVLAGGAHSAFGAGTNMVRPNGAARDINAGANWKPAGAAAAFPNNGIIINSRTDTGGTGGAMQASDAVGNNIRAINVYGNAGASLTIDRDGTRLGSVYNDTSNEARVDAAAIDGNDAPGADANARLAVTVNDGKNLILDGNGGQAAAGGGHAVPQDDYSALGAVTLGSGGANTAKVTINSGRDAVVRFGDQAIFDGARDDDGTLDVKSNARFAAAQGATHRLKAVEISAAKTADFRANVTTNQLKLLNENAVAKFGDGATLTVTNNDGVLTSGDNHGIIQFEKGGTVAGNFGANNAIKEFRIGVEADAANGILASGGTVELTGKAGALDSKAQEFTFKHTDSRLKISTTNNQNIYGTFKGAEAGRGAIELDGGINVNLFGSVGTAAEKLNKVEFKGDDTLTIEGPGLWANTITANAGDQGKLSVRGTKSAAANAPATFSLNVSEMLEANPTLSELNILTSKDSTNANTVTQVSLNGTLRTAATNLVAAGGKNHELTLEENAQLFSGTTTFNVADQKLILKDGSLHKGDIASNGGDEGIISVQGDATLEGNNVGTNAAKLKEIKFDTADKTLTRTVTGNSETATNAGINFANDGTLVFKGDFDHVIISPVVMGNTVADGVGTIMFDAAIQGGKTLSIAGAIGAHGNDNQRLKELKNMSGADLVLSGAGGAHINTYTFGNNTRLDLTENNATYRFDHFNNGGSEKGKLHINADNVTIRTKMYADTDENFNLTKLSEIQINGNKNINIAENSLLRASSLRTAAIGGQGTLKFAGNAVFDAEVSLTNLIGGAGASALNAIELNGANSTVDYRSSTNVVGNVQFKANNATFLFSGQKLTAANVSNAAGVVGSTLELASTANEQEINADITGGADMTVKFSGRNVTLGAGKTSASTNYVFNSENAMYADLLTSNLNNANFSVTKDNVVNTVRFTADAGGATDFAGNLGGDKAMTFEVQNNAAFKVSTNANSANASFTAAQAANAAQIEFDGAANVTTEVASIGTQERAYDLVTFTSDGKINKDVWSKQFVVAANRTAMIVGAVGGAVDNSAFGLNDGSTVEFSGDGLVLGHAILNNSGVNHKGTAKFGNINSTIEKNLGQNDMRLKDVLFEFEQGSDKSVTLRSNIYAENTRISNGTVNIVDSQGVGIRGNLLLDGTAVNLTNDLGVLEGDLTLNGNVSFNTSYSVVNGQPDVGAIGIAEGKTLIANNGTALTINLNDSTNDIPSSEAVSVNLLVNAGTDTISDVTQGVLAAAAGKEVNVSGNTLAKWTLEVDARGNLTLKRESRALEELQRIATTQNVAGDQSANSDSLNTILTATGKTGEYAKELAAMSTESPDRFKDSFQRYNTNTVAAVEEHNEKANTMVSSRNAQVSLPSVSGSDQNNPAVVAYDDYNISGVAAGDSHDKYGVWATPFFSQSTQKSRKNAPGYRGEGYGLTAGFDTKVNDDTIIGAAVTYATSDVKHKDAKSGDKTKLDSYMFSVYGSQQLTANWFLLGSATVGANQVKNNSIRVAQTKNEIAKSKYNSMSFNGELLAGYNFVMNDFAATPMAGFRYSRVNDGGYEETGTTNQNLNVTKKASDKFEVVAGLRLSGAVYDMQGVSLTPEVHGFVNHDLINKNAGVTVKADGANKNLSQTSAKPVKTTYNLGAGVNARYGMMEYGATYDASLATKFVSHQGTLKIRVNF